VTRAVVARLRRSTALRWAAFLLAAYLVVGWIFAWASRTRGLLSPGGSPHVETLALGVLYVLLRVAVRFGVPALVAGALVHLGVSFITAPVPVPPAGSSDQ